MCHSTQFVLLLLLPVLALAGKGFDAMDYVTPSQFACMSSRNYTRFLSLVWNQGTYDSTGFANLQKASASGMSLDASLIPCMTSSCPDVGNQVEAAINKIRLLNLNVSTIWIYAVDTETWSTVQSENHLAYIKIVQRATALGMKAGVLADREGWARFFGLEFDHGLGLPLWWYKTNRKADLTTDFIPFGGWTTPTVHTYTQNYEPRCENVHTEDAFFN